nr:protein phosphatase methylesterase 1 [Quercus suber]
MSNILRQKINDSITAGHPITRPKPRPITTAEPDEHISSDSSASSAASITTIRPSSRDQTPHPAQWTNFFSQELWLDQQTSSQHAHYHVYLTPPSDPKKGPLFICHHGAGSTGMSFAAFTQSLLRKIPEAGVLSLDARAHGSEVIDPTTSLPSEDFSLTTLSTDARAMINLTQAQLNWPSLPPTILIGHSLGAAVVTDLASIGALGRVLIGYVAIDVVEGSALEALSHMQSYLSQRPQNFPSVDDAVSWHLRTRTLRNSTSANASVPSLLTPVLHSPSTPLRESEEKEHDPSAPQSYTWKTALASTQPFWSTWFTGMSSKFLSAPYGPAKMLILAGTDRLDRELMIGQMQGKFQLVVVPEAGHFVHEDVPEKTAGQVEEFFRRNDRSAMVMPLKVDEMVRLGRKV